MITESKRRGRPPKARPADDAVVEIVEADVVGDEAPPVANDGPPCHLCRRPMERSTTMLRRYELNACFCKRCQHVGIEGDDQWWDVKTAPTGNPPKIVRRAMTLYEIRNGVTPPPPAERDAGYEAATSEWGDPRWVEFEF